MRGGSIFRWKKIYILIKSIVHKTFSQTNNDGLKVVFYKHFSNELAPVLLDAYDSCEKLATRGFTSRTGIICTIKKGDKRDIENNRHISFHFTIIVTMQFLRIESKNIRYNNRWKPVRSY